MKKDQNIEWAIKQIIQDRKEVTVSRIRSHLFLENITYGPGEIERYFSARPFTVHLQGLSSFVDGFYDRDAAAHAAAMGAFEMQQRWVILTSQRIHDGQWRDYWIVFRAALYREYEGSLMPIAETIDRPWNVQQRYLLMKAGGDKEELQNAAEALVHWAYQARPEAMKQVFLSHEGLMQFIAELK